MPNSDNTLRIVSFNRDRETPGETQAARYQSLIEAQSNAGIGMLTIENGRISFVNEALCRLFDYSAEEIMALPDFDVLFHPDDRARLRANHQRRLSGEQFENRYFASIVTRTGERREVELTASPLGGKSINGVLALMVDVTEQRHAERQARQSEEHFSQVFRVSPVAASIARAADGVFLEVNDIYPRNFGWSRDEMIGRSSVDIGLWPSNEVRKPWIETLRRDRITIDFETVWCNKAGEYRNVRISAAMTDFRGEPCVLALIHDITELRQLHTELEQRVRERTAALAEVNQELESFAYSVSHDLRAPLRGIDGFSHLLQEEYGDRLDAQGNEYLVRVRRATQRLGDLIDDLLELSRVTRHPIQHEKIDLSALVADISEDLRKSSPERQADLAIESGHHCTGDSHLLRVLLENLVGNAWKYTGRCSQPKIEFGAEQVGAETVYFVRDNGAGFDMAYANKLFVPFQRLHNPAEFQGTGVGLASAARAVRRHGGRIWAQAAVGQGATFFFTLESPPDPRK